jgi:hypothetical protein
MSKDLTRRGVPWLGLLGSVILVAALLLAPGTDLPEEQEERVVKVSRQQVQGAIDAAMAEDPSLKDDMERLEEEMRRGAVAQALLVEEAFRQGIAESDYIVRNRLVEMQVMSLYERADAMVTPEAVDKFYEDNRERYVTRPRRYYLHLFVPITNVVGDQEARARLEEEFKAEAWGEPRRVTEDDLRKVYGPTLARMVFEMPLHKWSDAYQSSLGWHYLQVVDEEPVRALSLDEVRTRVTEDVRRDLRNKMYEQEIERLKKKYRVEETD